MEFYLNPHVFVCRSSRYVVILDVQRDRYSCVLGAYVDLIAPWLCGWREDHVGEARERSDRPGAAADEVIRAFLSQGVLTSDRAHSKPVCPVSVPAPTCATTGATPSRTAKLAKLPSFFLACRRADAALRHSRFEDVVRRVASRQAVGGRRCLATAASKDRATRLAAIFKALRPLYLRPYLCTFDSLALLEFLALHRLHARWIFGVRAEPFHAHCWVQHGEALLNERLDRAARLTPILAV